MKRVIIIGLLAMGVCAVAVAQEYDPILDEVSGRRRQEKDRGTINTQAINRHIEGRLGGWVAVSFDFVTLPGPLSVARANLTMEIIRGRPGDTFDEDWEFWLKTSPFTVTWLSDETVLWTGKKTHGDRLVVPIEFVTKVSGANEFNFLTPNLVGMGGGVRVEWCLDGDGQLISLWNPRHGQIVGCGGVRSTFFNQDSVSLNEPSQVFHSDAPFSTRMTITPPFRIGDTSTVRFFLRAKELIPDGLDFHFSTVHMKVLSFPDRIDFPIAVGQTIEFAIDVVPAAVRNVQTIGLNTDPDFRAKPRGPKETALACSVVFHEDGSLRYVHSQGVGNIDKSLLPQSYPKATDDGARVYHTVFKDKPHPYPELVRKK